MNYNIHFELYDTKDFEIFSYPGGEKQVRITQEKRKWAIEQFLSLQSEGRTPNVLLTARLTENDGPVDLILALDALEVLLSPYYVGHCDLFLPYLPYGRADRRFTEGDCFGLKVFLSVVNTAIQLNTIITLDAHNASIASRWSRLPFFNISPEKYINKAITDFALRYSANKINVLYPDKGAATRYSIAKELSSNTYRLELNFIHADKVREPETGKITDIKVPELNSLPTIIIDDICDGGGTFLGINAQYDAPPPMALYTTHGIYSKGTRTLTDVFDHVYCTNSYLESYISHPNQDNFTVFNINPNEP